MKHNTNESRILVTTSVGLYPNGISPYGLHDTSGNVWQWTADWYQAYPGGEASEDFGEKLKVVRGDSWYLSHRSARCACRRWGVPVNFFDILKAQLAASSPTRRRWGWLRKSLPVRVPEQERAR